MDGQNEFTSEARKRRLAELDRITEIQSARNLDLNEQQAEALIQRYLEDDRSEFKQSTHDRK